MSSALMQNYARYPIAFERGEGMYLYDSDGNRYLDFAAGIAVDILGHAHPHLVAALTEQAEKLWHVSNMFEIPGQERMARRLTERCFADVAFFANSGAEAMECAIKMARRYHWARGEAGRHRLITFDGAFHGRTMATVSAAAQDKHLEGFRPAVEGFDPVPFGDLDAVRDAAGPETAGILIEPVQGESGIRPAPASFLQGLREIADENGILLILDEVQCGMGRTGKLFAHEWADIEPDIMALAKGIGGGFPLGVCMATREAAECMAPGSHGSTFGGNPLACAVGNAVLDIVLEDGFLESVRETSDFLSQQLAGLVDAHPGILVEARGVGLMRGLKAGIENKAIIAAGHAAGLITVPAGDNVVRLVPPLIATPDHVREAVDCLDRACAAAMDERA